MCFAVWHSTTEADVRKNDYRLLMLMLRQGPMAWSVMSEARSVMSEVIGVVQRVGDHRVVDENEQGQVGQEAQQVQGAHALEFLSDDCFLFRVDPPGLQLQQQLLCADEALLGHSAPCLPLQ